ncbi:MAG: hypothetical protein JKY67_20170, partial [Pseudomonadales bacterium]|nr:hypothetical protein [Pseudomonadales bacterium]
MSQHPASFGYWIQLSLMMLFLAFVGGVNADETSREAALFGEEPVNNEEIDEFQGVSTDSIVKLFSQKLSAVDGRLDIGGRYYHSSIFLYSENTSIGETNISHTGV